jgi:hypothetical protein
MEVSGQLRARPLYSKEIATSIHRVAVITATLYIWRLSPLTAI